MLAFSTAIAEKEYPINDDSKTRASGVFIAKHFLVLASLPQVKYKIWTNRSCLEEIRMDNHKTIPMIMFKYRNSALIILLWASMISMQNNFTLSNIWILTLQNQNLHSNIKLSPFTRHMIYLTLYPWVSMKSILILKHLYYVNVTSDCYLNCLPINIWYCAIILCHAKTYSSWICRLQMQNSTI